MRTTLFTLAVCVLLSGCAASARVVVLQNPETKQTVDCRVDGSVSRPYLKQENCIKAYEKVGYTVASDSDN